MTISHRRTRHLVWAIDLRGHIAISHIETEIGKGKGTATEGEETEKGRDTAEGVGTMLQRSTPARTTLLQPIHRIVTGHTCPTTVLVFNRKIMRICSLLLWGTVSLESCTLRVQTLLVAQLMVLLLLLVVVLTREWAGWGKVATRMGHLVLMNITMVILLRTILLLILLLRYDFFRFYFIICIWLILETTSNVKIDFVLNSDLVV